MTTYDRAKVSLTKDEQKNAIAFLYKLHDIKKTYGDDTPKEVENLLKIGKGYTSLIKEFTEKAERKVNERKESKKRYQEEKKRDDKSIRIGLLNVARTMLNVGDILHLVERSNGQKKMTAPYKVVRVTKAFAFVSGLNTDGTTGHREIQIPRFAIDTHSWKSAYVSEIETYYTYREYGKKTSWRIGELQFVRPLNNGASVNDLTEYHLEKVQSHVYGW